MDSQRLARQDLLRRRDISLYTGLHPRLLHAAASGPTAPPQQPRLSLLKTSTPCRAFPCAQPNPAPQMPSPASFNPEQPQNLGAKKKLKKRPPTPEESDEDDGVAEDGVLPTEFLYENTNSSRRPSSPAASDELFPSKQCKKQNNSTLEEILGIQPESGIFSDDSIRVYRAEIPTMEPALDLPPKAKGQPEVAKQPQQQPQPQCKSDILLGAILRTCERNRHLEESSDKPRLRSLSDNLTFPYI